MFPVIDTGSRPLSELLPRLWAHLSRRRRRQFVAVVLAAVVSAGMEMASLGSVLPFIAVLVDPDMALDHAIVARLAGVLGIESTRDLVIPLTVGFVGLAVVAAGFRLAVLWLGIRFAVATGADLNAEVYLRTLHQPYPVHMSRSSSEVISGIVDKVEVVGGGVLFPIQTIITSAMMIMAILITLVLVDPLVAVGTMIGFGGAYAVISVVSRHRLRRHGTLIAEKQTLVLSNLQEGLGGIRDVLLDGTQPVFAESYRQVDRPLRRAVGDINFIVTAPRFVMEAVGMIVIAVLAFVLSRQVGGVAGALPVLGALALGGQRIMPALQMAFASWSMIVSKRAHLDEAIRLLEQPLPEGYDEEAPAARGVDDVVRFRDVSFRYAQDEPWVLEGINLDIPAGSSLGVVGGTGSGKSTLLDVFMGLLTPQEGSVIIDGEVLTDRRCRSWQRAVAHVPQHIFLADTTIANNIAFGFGEELIDVDRVVAAARQASIDELIRGRVGGYDARIGERGIRLSGGQRQRLGIARALYRTASVLVLDEATSALDAATESKVIDAIKAADGLAIVVIVAHRLGTVRHCDLIVELSDGRVTAFGTYEELMETSPSFRFAAGSGETGWSTRQKGVDRERFGDGDPQ